MHPQDANLLQKDQELDLGISLGINVNHLYEDQKIRVGVGENHKKEDLGVGVGADKFL